MTVKIYATRTTNPSHVPVNPRHTNISLIIIKHQKNEK